MPISRTSGRPSLQRLQTRSCRPTMMDATSFLDPGMKRAIVVALGVGAVITSAAAIGIGAGGDTPAAQALSAHEYRRALRQLDATDPDARCDALAEPAREVCRVEAASARMVQVAELESSYRRDRQSARALQRARIEARYQVDRAHCGALGGFKRDRCLVKAHAAKGRALLEAAAPYEVRYTP